MLNLPGNVRIYLCTKAAWIVFHVAAALEQAISLDADMNSLLDEFRHASAETSAWPTGRS